MRTLDIVRLPNPSMACDARVRYSPPMRLAWAHFSAGGGAFHLGASTVLRRYRACFSLFQVPPCLARVLSVCISSLGYWIASVRACWSFSDMRGMGSPCGFHNAMGQSSRLYAFHSCYCHFLVASDHLTFLPIHFGRVLGDTGQKRPFPS